MTYAPTAEQAAIIDAAKTGRNLVIEAGAGTGKTSTLRMLAEAKPNERGLYIAYNKAIALDAAASFPASVLCKTAHGLAYAAVGKKFAHRLKGGRLPSQREAGGARGDQEGAAVYSGWMRVGGAGGVGCPTATGPTRVMLTEQSDV